MWKSDSIWLLGQGPTQSLWAMLDGTRRPGGLYQGDSVRRDTIHPRSTKSKTQHSITLWTLTKNNRRKIEAGLKILQLFQLLALPIPSVPTALIFLLSSLVVVCGDRCAATVRSS